MIRICPLCYITVSMESEKKKRCSNCMASFYHYKPRLVSIDFVPPESNKKLDTDNSLLENTKGNVDVLIGSIPNLPSPAKDDSLQKSQQTRMDNMDNQLLFTVASKVASTINGILTNGGKVEKSTKLYMYENSVSIGDFPMRDALLEVELSEIQGFNEFKESLESGVFIQPAIDMFSINIAKYIISKPSNKISRSDESPKNGKHWIVIIVLSVLLFLFVAFRSSYHVSFTEILGIVPFTMFVAENIGTSLIPFVVSYAVYFRKKSRNTSYIAFLCLWLAATAGALTNLTNKSQSSETLQRIYSDTKMSLPAIIDSHTRLDSILLNGNTLNYLYTLTDLGDIDVSESDFENFSKSIKSRFCTTPITRKALDENGIFILNYYNKNNNFIGTVTVKKGECS